MQEEDQIDRRYHLPLPRKYWENYRKQSNVRNIAVHRIFMVRTIKIMGHYFLDIEWKISTTVTSQIMGKITVNNQMLEAL